MYFVFIDFWVAELLENDGFKFYNTPKDSNNLMIMVMQVAHQNFYDEKLMFGQNKWRL